jgi:hypothetical protein
LKVGTGASLGPSADVSDPSLITNLRSSGR